MAAVDGTVRSGRRWRLHVGDCLDVAATLPDGAVDATVTDPPWNRGKDYGRNDDRLPSDVYVTWLGEVVAECLRVSRGGVVCFLDRWHATALSALQLPIVGLLPWQREAGWWEPIVWFGARATAQRAPVDRTLRALAGPHRDDGFAASHPCPKPLSAVTPLVRAVAPPGGTVLDPFSGTGTTLVAALRTGRRGLGVELEPRFARIASDRCARTEDASVEAAH